MMKKMHGGGGGGASGNTSVDCSKIKDLQNFLSVAPLQIFNI